MKTTFFCAMTLVVFSATLSAATIRNEQYGFEVTVPDSWSAKKVVQDDPDVAMKSQEFSFSLGTGSEEEEPKNWNGVAFNNSGGSYDVPPPVVILYAHEKKGQTPEEFAKLLERTIGMFGGKIVKSTKTATGLDYTYDLFTMNRFVVRYENGRRFVLHYMVPSADRSLFKRYEAEVDAVIRSLRVVK